MKVNYTKGNLACIAEGTPAEVYRQIAEFTETFQDSVCGACGEGNIDYVIRKVEDNEFFEVHCRNPKCRAKLSYGHGKADNKLYPKRAEVDKKGKVVKDENGKTKWLPNNGWTIYKPE